MRFELSEDQQEIQSAARELLAARSDVARVRTFAEGTATTTDTPEDTSTVAGEDGALWAELADLGWTGMAIPEEHGGQGLGVIELATIAEELGYAIAAVPFLGSVTAALVLQHEGSDRQRDAWLASLASGKRRGAVTLAGDQTPVPGAATDGLVVVADEGGAAVVYGPGSGIVEPTQAIDPTRGHGRVAVTAVAGDGNGGEPLPGTGTVPGAGVDRATIVVAAELVGVMQRAMDMTVSYVKDRRQFGVPVGAFQAVQHGAAQMLRDVTMARTLTYHAAWVADHGDPGDLRMAASMAKAAASDAGRTVTAAAVQLHGGIGFTWEADVHWLLKRAQIDAVLLGGAQTHRQRVAAEAWAGPQA